MDAFTAQQTTELVSRIGTKKATMRLDKLFINSVMAGPLLGFGCAVTLSVNTAPWYQSEAPGLIRMVGALLFPIGLVMITLTGADLFTTNIMFMTTAFLHRRVTLVDVLKNWFVSFFGNLAGMLFFMAIVTGYGDVFTDTNGYKTEILKFAKMKAVDPLWHQIMLRGIGANWLVCLAVWLSISAREIVSKITAIWWPTATFVALALDHVIANMYFIPTAIFYGSPDISVGYYIWKSMIPTTIGNMIGGGLLVALPYWYLYLTGEGATEVDFNIGAIQSAIREVGGPLRRQEGSGHVLKGRDMDAEHPAAQLPHSGSGMASAVSKELSQEKYGKSLAEKNSDHSSEATV